MNSGGSSTAIRTLPVPSAYETDVSARSSRARGERNDVKRRTPSASGVRNSEFNEEASSNACFGETLALTSTASRIGRPRPVEIVRR